MDIDKAIDEQEDAIPADNSMEKEQYCFRQAGDGNSEGLFINKILNISEKNQAAINAAILRNGLPADTFSERDRGRQDAIGWLKASLIKRPAWCKEFGKLKDDAVIVDLWNVAQEHEQIFRGSK